MILEKGEKIHVIHRRHFQEEARRHFIGVVDGYESGVARVTGYIYSVDRAKFSFVKRPELRTRIVSLVSGDLFINVIPSEVDLEKVVYKQEDRVVRVTDGTDWHLDLSEVAWM
jgi:hypothetical protein